MYPNIKLCTLFFIILLKIPPSDLFVSPSAQKISEIVAQIILNIGFPKSLITIGDINSSNSELFEFLHNNLSNPNLKIEPCLKNGTPSWNNDESSAIAKFNEAKYNKFIIVPISLLNLLQEKFSLILLNSVTIVIQNIPNFQLLTGDNYPPYTFLINSTGTFRLCHFCQEASNWTSFGFSVQTKFHSAPIFIRNAGLHNDTAVKKIRPGIKLTREFVHLLTLKAYLAIQIQEILNVSVHLLHPSDERLCESVNFWETNSTIYKELLSFGEKKEIKFITRLGSNRFDFSRIKGPYSTTFAIMFCAASLIMAIFMFAILKLRKNKPWSWLSSVELILRMVLDQHLEILPSQSTPFRVSLCTWLLFCVVITEAYRGEIVGRLLKPKYLKGPKSFGEIIDAGRATFTRGLFQLETQNCTEKETNGTCPFVWISNAIDLFENEIDARNLSKHVRILNALKSDVVENWEKIDDRLRNSNDAFFDDAAILERIVQVDRHFGISKESISRYLYNSVSKNMFHARILKIFGAFFTSGFVTYKLQNQKDVDTDSFISDLRNKGSRVTGELHASLKVSHFRTFLVYIFGLYFTAGVIILIEKAVKEEKSTMLGKMRRSNKYNTFYGRFKLRLALYYISIYSEFPKWEGNISNVNVLKIDSYFGIL
ncbi:hypothetical protein Fcan01_20254 [Folsomia candida]|uniref:Uncharacterized protein n=1 Tax=Folsomia candida TaxID=158441 RepID=A0A226DL85_FOLCA|nr:hypothetical protein Fcan01_20254 [Folsomia candida]